MKTVAEPPAVSSLPPKISPRSQPNARGAAVPEARAVITGIGAALPPLRVTQKQALAWALEHFDIKPATRRLYERVFSHPSIATRHFAADDWREILNPDLDATARRFEKWAVKLSGQSLLRACVAAGQSPRDLACVATTTCTGTLCPGLSAHLVETAGLSAGVLGLDLAGMGCGAALPALWQAAQFIRANPARAAAVVSTEICSAAVFSDDAVDLVISNALFADGSAAAVLQAPGHVRPDAAGAAHPIQICDYAARIVPEWRDALRFRIEKGRLRNVLAKEVPEYVGEAVSGLVREVLAKNGLQKEDVAHWLVHSGGDKIISHLKDVLALDEEQVAASRGVLRDHGNLSSPTVLFVLQRELRDRPPAPGVYGLLVAFGAGFSAHALLVRF